MAKGYRDVCEREKADKYGGNPVQLVKDYTAEGARGVVRVLFRHQFYLEVS